MARERKTAHLDPLEAAKAPPVPSQVLPAVGSRESGAGVLPLDGPLEAGDPSRGPTAPAPGPDASGAILAPAEPILPPPPPVVALVGRFEVQRRVSVWFRGQHIKLSQGEIISEAHYGPGSMSELRDAGVALREI